VLQKPLSRRQQQWPGCAPLSCRVCPAPLCRPLAPCLNWAELRSRPPRADGGTASHNCLTGEWPLSFLLSREDETLMRLRLALTMLAVLSVGAMPAAAQDGCDRLLTLSKSARAMTNDILALV